MKSVEVLSQKLFALGLAYVLVHTVAGGAVVWDNPSGSTTYFDWSNGHNQTGLFGSPILISDNTFLFFPSLFRAEASDGATDSKSDTLTFDLQMKSPYCLAGLKVTEYGDYGILGNNSMVQASGQLTLESLVNATNLTTTINMTPNFPVSSGFGTWSGYGELQGVFCNSVRVSVSNDLVAVSSLGTTTYIEKKLLGSAIEIVIIPEPVTFSLLSVGVLFARQKKRCFK